MAHLRRHAAPRGRRFSSALLPSSFNRLARSLSVPPECTGTAWRERIINTAGIGCPSRGFLLPAGKPLYLDTARARPIIGPAMSNVVYVDFRKSRAETVKPA